MTYCEYIETLHGEQLLLHRDYHDNDYGFPVNDDNKLFERLMFEINQAGLSWILILKKQDAFRKAFDNYNIEKVAAYDENDVSRLLSNSGIIRNRLKIRAAIDNANVILRLKKEHGSFKNWLDLHAEKNPSLKEWTAIFRENFRFTGCEIVNEFLVSTAYLPGAHGAGCPVQHRINMIMNITK